MLIDDLELARTVMASDGVDCVVAQVRKPGKQPKKLVSCTGGTFFGRRGEAWPTDDHGVPLIPWIQVVEYHPLRVHYKKAVCFFISQTFGQWDQGHSTTDNGMFVAREYEKDDRLVPLSRPSLLKGHPFRRVKWKRELDYPLLSKYKSVFSQRVLAELKRNAGASQHQRLTKIEGWPTVEDDAETVFTGTWDLQLAISRKFTLGGRHFAWLRRETDGWAIWVSMLNEH